MGGRKMIRFYDGELINILPDSLKFSPEAVAVSYALKKAIQKLWDYAENTSVYSIMDILPEYIIDLLALELRTQYYKQDLELSMKRELVKNTLPWYIKAGTPSAVQELIAVVFGNGKEIDWFEYNGRPGCFRIQTTTPIWGEKEEEFFKLLWSIKRESAWLDALQIVLDGELSLSFFCGKIETSFETSIIDLRR